MNSYLSKSGLSYLWSKIKSKHFDLKDNPHHVNKEQVGLGNVRNVEEYSKDETYSKEEVDKLINEITKNYDELVKSTDGKILNQIIYPNNLTGSWQKSVYGLVFNGKEYVLAFLDISNKKTAIVVTEDFKNYEIKTILSNTWANDDYHSLAYLNGVYVLATYQNPSNSLFYSTDLVNWSKVADVSGALLTFNNKFVVVRYNTVGYSEDGQNWTISTPIWSSFAWQTDVKTFMCINNKLFANFKNSSDISQIYYSDDGISWNTLSLNGSLYEGITYCNGLYIVAVSTGIYYSSDLTTWNYVKNNSLNSSLTAIYDIFSDDSKFILIGNPNCFYSYNIQKYVTDFFPYRLVKPDGTKDITFFKKINNLYFFNYGSNDYPCYGIF